MPCSASVHSMIGGWPDVFGMWRSRRLAEANDRAAPRDRSRWESLAASPCAQAGKCRCFFRRNETQFARLKTTKGHRTEL